MKNQIFNSANNIYLLSHSIGRMPAATKKILQQDLLATWTSDNEDIWNHWLSSIDTFKVAIAGLFNAQANEFCPQTNISSGLTKFIDSLPTAHPTRRGILACENDFPSSGFVFQQATQKGYQLKTLSHDAKVHQIDTWDKALTSDIHSVFITHVHYNNSYKAPVSEITKLARERDIFSIVDVAQSAGVVPVDFTDWNADAVVGSCIKWLCGGPGAGWLWVNPNLVTQLQPSDVGWFSHKNPFEFDINHFEYAQDSSRFWGGTPSVIPFMIAANSIKLLNEYGVERIAKHNQTFIESIIEVVDPSTLVSPKDKSVRGGTLVINPRDREVVEENLRAADVQFDSRAQGIRLSPHIYNTADQIATVVECFKAAQ